MKKLLLLENKGGNTFLVPERVTGFPVMYIDNVTNVSTLVDDNFFVNGNIYNLVFSAISNSNIQDLSSSGIPLLNSGIYNTYLPFDYLIFFQTNA